MYIQDVLELHYARNRRPQPPSPSRLRRFQPQAGEPERDLAADAAEDEDEASQLTRNKRHSQTPKRDRCTNPTQLGFYPPKWKDLLEECKIETRTYAAVSEPWPQSKFAVNGFISDAIQMTMQKWRREQQTVEKRYYPKYRKSMCKLVRIWLVIYVPTNVTLCSSSRT